MNTNWKYEYEPISAPTPAHGWAAIFGSDGAFESELPVVDWALCKCRRVADRGGVTIYENDPNEIIGMIVTWTGGIVPARNISNLIGYRHRSQSIDDFMKEYET
jgi:hypothetical protein